MSETSQTQAPVAVVTGTSTGFGRLTAETLARNGYRVFAGLRGIDGRNAAVAAEFRTQGIEPIELDVTSDASVDAAAKHVLSTAGRVDVLVNNAGSAYFGLVEAFTIDAVQRQYDVNVFGPLRVNRAFLPSMRERRSGLVVYISSIVGRFTGAFMGVYASSKYAIEALAESSAYELKPFGVDVSIIQPGAYATDIFSKQVFADDVNRNATYGELGGKAEEMAQGMKGGAGNPQDVADAVLDLAKRAPGTRPLRRPVGDGTQTVGKINAALEPLHRGLLEAFGMGSMAPATFHDEFEPQSVA